MNLELATELLAGLFDGLRFQHSEMRDDPLIGPIIVRSHATYNSAKRVPGSSFTGADHLAVSQAIREVLDHVAREC